MSRPLTLLFVSLVPFAAPLYAQQLTEGHTAVVHALPAGAGNHLETAFGTVYFNGSDLMLTRVVGAAMSGCSSIGRA